MRKGKLGVFLCAVLTLSVGNAAAGPYSFTNIADSSGAFSGFFSFDGPSLNNSGTVAFPAGLDTGGAGIFTGSGGPTTTIVDDSGPFSGFGFVGPSLNDSGTVAFFARLDTGEEGIFTGSGGPTTTLYDSSGPFNFDAPVFGNPSPSINDSGTVAFSAGLDTGGQGIFTGSGGPTTTIVDTSGFGELSLNDSGTVAFFAGGIFTGSGGPTTTIVDDSAFAVSPFGLSLNNSGTVAFALFNFDLQSSRVLARNGHSALVDEPNPPGIFTGSGGPITTIADSFFFDFLNLSRPSLSLNDSGTVAFLAGVLLCTPEQGCEEGSTGIFTGPDPLAHEVISVGDSLFGSNVMNIFIGSQSLNDTGQIAFFYELADGRTGIARADPLAVPEPGTLPLLVAALLGAVLWRKTNRALVEADSARGVGDQSSTGPA